MPRGKVISAMSLAAFDPITGSGSVASETSGWILVTDVTPAWGAAVQLHEVISYEEEDLPYGTTTIQGTGTLEGATLLLFKVRDTLNGGKIAKNIQLP